MICNEMISNLVKYYGCECGDIICQNTSCLWIYSLNMVWNALCYDYDWFSENIGNNRKEWFGIPNLRKDKQTLIYDLVKHDAFASLKWVLQNYGEEYKNINQAMAIAKEECSQLLMDFEYNLQTFECLDNQGEGTISLHDSHIFS